MTTLTALGMTKVEYSDRTCNDCDSELLRHNPRAVFGCDECEKAWSRETLEDWPDSTQMPFSQFPYSEIFKNEPIDCLNTLLTPNSESSAPFVSATG